MNQCYKTSLDLQVLRNWIFFFFFFKVIERSIYIFIQYKTYCRCINTIFTPILSYKILMIMRFTCIMIWYTIAIQHFWITGQVRSECLTCTFRASCCSARLSRAQVSAFAGSSVRDRKKKGVEGVRGDRLHWWVQGSTSSLTGIGSRWRWFGSHTLLDDIYFTPYVQNYVIWATISLSANPVKTLCASVTLRN